jgi:hypothetical protein
MGWVRSSAWIWLFSSAHRTSARSGGVEIEPHHVAHLVDERRIGGELEGFCAVGLKPEGPPDARDSRLRDPAGSGHLARRPVGGAFGRLLEGRDDDLLDLFVAHRPRRSGTRLVQKPLHAALDEAPAPPADRLAGHPQRLGDLAVGRALGRAKDDARPKRERLGRRWAPRKALERSTLLLAHHERRKRATTSHGHLLRRDGAKHLSWLLARDRPFVKCLQTSDSGH